MSYKILYDPEMNHKYSQHKQNTSFFSVTAVLTWAAILIAAVSIFVTSEKVRYWLLPGDPAVTEAAFIEFVADLETGEPMAEAFADFCVAVIKDERISE